MPEVQPTNNPVPSDHPADARDNFKRIDEFVNLQSLQTSPTRTGKAIDTLFNITTRANDQIDRIGFEVPVAYTAGLVMSRTSQTVIFMDDVYHAINVPFTTSGTFETNNFELLRAVTSADLTNSQEQIIGGGASIFPEFTSSNISNGSVIPSGTTHVRVSGSLFSITPIVDGVVSLLTSSGCTIGATPVVFSSAISSALVLAAGSSVERSLSERFSDNVNVKDFGAVGDGVADDYAAIQGAINYAKSQGSRSVIIPDTGSVYRVSQTLKFDVNSSEARFYGTLAPHGAFAGFLVEFTTDRTGNPFFDGSNWLWPKNFSINVKVDGRSPDQSTRQSKAVFLNRVSHSVITIFAEFCIEQSVTLTGCIENDLFITERLCGTNSASYVTHNSQEWCCQRAHSSSREPGVATDYWSVVPTGSAPTTALNWVGGTSYGNGADGACLYLYDPAGAQDSNNNLRFYGYNAAYPGGAMLHIDCDQSQFGARNIFFYGAQLHHQDGDITGSEGAGQPNYPGPLPAAASKQSYGVGVELKNCEAVHFIGGNWRKGLEAGGTLFHFGDGETMKACRDVTFSQGTHSGDGGTATGTELTLFDFELVAETLSSQGVVFGDGIAIREVSAGSKIFRGDISKLTKNRFGRESKTMLGSATDTAYDQNIESDPLARYSVRADGRQSWGDGSNAQDCGLVRNGPGLLYADTGKIGANEGFIIGSGYSAGGSYGAVIGTEPRFGPGGGLIGYVLIHAPS